jgi:hypothetical protein
MCVRASGARGKYVPDRTNAAARLLGFFHSWATFLGSLTRGGSSVELERVLYHSTRRAVPERSWVQSLVTENVSASMELFLL